MQLDHEQQVALDAMLAGQNVFLTGRAGTGKSAVINEFIHHHPADLVCVAPTGLAARNLTEAGTIHRTFGLPSGVLQPGNLAYILLEKRPFLSTVKTLLIDEISMVRSDTFNVIDCLLRESASSGYSGLPFGGKQIIVVGDFYQLPPVVREQAVEEYLEEHLNGIYAFNTLAWQSARFQNIELTQIHRQTEPEFIAFLNSVREMDTDLQERLHDANGRIAANRSTDGLNGPICLCCSRDTANKINAQALAQLPDNGVEIMGEKWGEFPDDELPVSQVLLLKRGMRIMLLGNRSHGTDIQQYEYVNGDQGEVLCYDPIARAILVKLDRGPIVKVTQTCWTHYEYTTWRNEEGKLQIVQDETGKFWQYPVMPAYATTIHKTQGQTLEKAHVILGDGCFAPGQLYTALSRVRSFDSLTLDRPIRFADALGDAMVQAFMKDLNRSKWQVEETNHSLKPQSKKLQ